MKFRIITDKARRIQLNMDSINEYTERWKPGTRLEVSIVRRMPKGPIRGQYWKYIFKPFALEQGYDRQDWPHFHKQLRALFFNIETDHLGMYKRKVPPVFRDDADVEHKKKFEFIDFVVKLAARQGVYLEWRGLNG